jgi:hypothetical protein
MMWLCGGMSAKVSALLSQVLWYDGIWFGLKEAGVLETYRLW